MKKIRTVLFGIMLAVAAVVQLAVVVPAAAQTDQKTVTCGNDQVAVSIPVNGQNCVNKGNTVEDNVIIVWLTALIKFVTVGVGIAVVGGVVYGGFLYLTARGNSGQIQKSIATILNSLIALALYALAFSLINFLIPGGVLR